MQPVVAIGWPAYARFNPMNSRLFLHYLLDSDLEYGDPGVLGTPSSALGGGLRPALVAFWHAAGMSDPLSAQGTRRHHRSRSREAGDARSRVVIDLLSKSRKTGMSQAPKYLPRSAAGPYLFQNFGFGSSKSLATWASRGIGPRYSRVLTGGPAVYEVEELNRWALEQLSAPITSPRDLVHTAEAEATAA